MIKLIIPVIVYYITQCNTRGREQTESSSTRSSNIDEAGMARSVRRLGYGLDDPVLESRQGQEICLFSETSRQTVRLTLSPVQWLPAFFRGVGEELKLLGREVDHSLPFNAEAQNEWSYIFTPPSHLLTRTGKNSPFSFFRVL